MGIEPLELGSRDIQPTIVDASDEARSQIAGAYRCPRQAGVAEARGALEWHGFSPGSTPTKMSATWRRSARPRRAPQIDGSTGTWPRLFRATARSASERWTAAARAHPQAIPTVTAMKTARRR
jgi:hypothetical protein